MLPLFLLYRRRQAIGGGFAVWESGPIAKATAKARAIYRSLRPLGFTRAFGRVEGLLGVLNAKAEALAYLRSKGKGEKQILRFAKDDN